MKKKISSILISILLIATIILPILGVNRLTEIQSEHEYYSVISPIKLNADDDDEVYGLIEQTIQLNADDDDEVYGLMEQTIQLNADDDDEEFGLTNPSTNKYS